MKKKITEAEVTLDDINKKYTSLQLQILITFDEFTINVYQILLNLSKGRSTSENKKIEKSLDNV